MGLRNRGRRKPAAVTKVGELWDRLIPCDWSGQNSEVTGWQRKLHIHQVPFYYVEYGLHSSVRSRFSAMR